MVALFSWLVKARLHQKEVYWTDSIGIGQHQKKTSGAVLGEDSDQITEVESRKNFKL